MDYLDSSMVAGLKVALREEREAKEAALATKNTSGKMVKRENAYEVWQSDDGAWTWYVLKKYQSPAGEAKNKYARWFVDVVSPMTPRGEMGDTYVSEIKANARRVK